MKLKVCVDRARCDGFGNCVVAATDIFDLDDSGVAIVKQDETEPQRLEAVRRAIYDCPTNAISVTEIE